MVVLCIWAAQWQYQRGVDRHARNTIIQERIAQEAINLKEIDDEYAINEWRKVSATGSFDQSKQIILRNRY